MERRADEVPVFWGCGLTPQVVLPESGCERVGRAVIAAAERAPEGFWPVNAVDPYGWTYAASSARSDGCCAGSGRR